jgi:uncharacterized membrane protein HdeD (DUF308 family)
MDELRALRNGADAETAALARNWWAVALRGVAAIVLGILTLALPAISLAAMILLYGAYVLVEGVFNLVAALPGRSGERPRWLLVLEGLVSVAGGVITLVFPGLTAVVLLYVIAGWALLTGVLEIIAAIRLRQQIEREWRLALSGILSVVFGALVMIFPGAGALAVVVWIGAYAVAFGALLLALAFRLRRARVEPRWTVARAA